MNKIPEYSCGTDDISFCFDSDKCKDETCFRNSCNMIHKDIPHSFSNFYGTEYCKLTNDKENKNEF